MSNQAVAELLENSQLVIRGTVRKVNASTLSELPASASTFVVRVGEVLHGPPEFKDHVGRDITLQSDNPKGLAVGGSAVFFTRSWLYGRTLAVVEVGRVPDKNPKSVDAGIKKAEEIIFDRRLGERIAKAELVVVGAVTDLGPGPEQRNEIETEHAPDWRQAYVKVHGVLKGKAPEQGIAVVFPASLDELWIESPKPRPGETGIFILQRNQSEKGQRSLRVPGLTALDPLDVQPVAMLDRVRRILKGGVR
jgi:hypothetical protein